MTRLNKSKDQWRRKLTPEQYRVLRQKGTEPPFTGKLLHNQASGMYACAACGQELFSSETKFDSITPGLEGWPSFSEVAKSGNVRLEEDISMGLKRTEVICSNCSGHLGHLFADPASPNGQHYCINSCALEFLTKPGRP